LTLVAPADAAELARVPLETVFVVDCSGSMKGAPLEVVRRALHRSLDLLTPQDGFQLIRFSDRAQSFSAAPLQANARNLTAGHDWIDALEANGGTEVMSGVDAAFGLEHDHARQRIVCFLTDGFLSNEDEILAAIRARRGDTRVFSVGIGAAPNRYLLAGMASEGRGAVAYLDSSSDAGTVMQKFLERASHPALTDLEIDWGRLDVADVCPRELPDLFPGRTAVISGRITSGFDGIDGSAIRVRGRIDGRVRDVAVPTRALEGSQRDQPLDVQWARARIADLASQSRTIGSHDARTTLALEVKRVALEHNLLSPYTAFVAVDSSSQTSGDHGVTVPVPVPVPAGTRYDTTVGGN
jgi:Ca-activated chloride channel family protein